MKMDCRTDALLTLRKTLLESAGMKVSVNDIVIRAVALSLRKVRLPIVCAWVSRVHMTHPIVCAWGV